MDAVVCQFLNGPVCTSVVIGGWLPSLQPGWFSHASPRCLPYSQARPLALLPCPTLVSLDKARENALRLNETCAHAAILKKKTPIRGRNQVLLGTHRGEVKLFDTYSGSLIDAYLCHDTPIYSIRPSLDQQRVLTSTPSLSEPRCSALWKLSNMHNPLVEFPDDRYALGWPRLWCCIQR
jgi:hypothetical protein